LLFGLRVYRETEIIKGSKRLELVSNIQAVAAARMVIALTGDPIADWSGSGRMARYAKALILS